MAIDIDKAGAIPSSRGGFGHRLWMKMGGWWGLLILLLVVGLIVWIARPKPAQEAANGRFGMGAPMAVNVAKAESGDMPVILNALGTVTPLATVTVRTQIAGQLQQVGFTEGQRVKKGDFLAQIDPRPYQATLEQAEANLEKDQSQLKGAELDLERYAKLVTPGFQTRQSYDDQKAMVGQLEGATKADQAMIDASKLNIEYASIRSPIEGRTGARQVDLGNFVQAAQATNLVTVTQMKPIFITFTVPQDALDQIRTNQANGELPVIAYAADDKTVLAQGKLTLVNNQIDPTTGTVQLKATFANDDERLWPGEFVNAKIVVSTRRNALTVPATTIMQGPNGSFAYVIKPDNTVQRQTVEVATTQEGIAVVDKGLTADDNVVVDGQYRLTQGSKVKTDQQAPGEQKQAANDGAAPAQP